MLLGIMILPCYATPCYILPNPSPIEIPTCTLISSNLQSLYTPSKPFPFLLPRPTTTTLPLQNPRPQNLLHHPQIIPLPINQPLNLLNIPSQLLNLALIKHFRLLDTLFHEKAGADIYNYFFGIRQCAGDVET